MQASSLHHLWATFRRPPRSSASLGKCQATRLASASALGIFSCVEVLGRPEKCMGSRLLWRWRLFCAGVQTKSSIALISWRVSPRAHAIDRGLLGAAGSVDPRGQGLDVRDNWRLAEVFFIICRQRLAVGCRASSRSGAEDRPVVLTPRARGFTRFHRFSSSSGQPPVLYSYSTVQHTRKIPSCRMSCTAGVDEEGQVAPKYRLRQK